MQVPSYDSYILENAGGPYPQSLIPKRMMRAERSLRCPYCRGNLARFQHDPVLYIGPEHTPSGGSLDETRGTDGLQIDDFLAVCRICGFWFGRGSRDWGSGPHMGRLIYGMLRQYDVDSIDVPTRELILYLHRNQNRLLAVNPFKAEELVEHIMKDAYGCEIERIGGRKDKGVDLYKVTGNKREAIVQIKWRQDRGRAEGVRVVRELCGTLIARGVPKGVLVTTRNYMSKDVIHEIDDIEASKI